MKILIHKRAHLCRSYHWPGASRPGSIAIIFFSILPFSVRVLDQLGVLSDHFATCPCIQWRINHGADGASAWGPRPEGPRAETYFLDNVSMGALTVRAYCSH